MASNVARNVRVFADRTLSPAALSARLASEARRLRDELVSSGQASPTWRTFVDGREDGSEDAAKQVIQYRFSQVVQAIGYALGFAIARSPVDSGEYRKAWFIAVDRRRWDKSLTEIPPGSEVMLINDVPYARKIDVGGMKMSVPPGIVEATRQAVQRAYPSVLAEHDFVLLPGGYVLKGRSRSRRKDRRAGQSLTYPALILRDR